MMLVLSRYKDERITIGDLGEIVIVDIRPNQVRLGFEFPREITIVRNELLRKSGPKVHRTEIED